MNRPPRPVPPLVRLLVRLLCPRDRREDLEGDLLELLETREPGLRRTRDLLSVCGLLLLSRLRAVHPRELGRDLVFAWRAVRRRPASSAMVIATLALGIGANTTIFSLVNAVLLRQMPVQDPKALVLLSVSSDTSGLGASFPHPFYRQLRESDDVLAGVICQARTSPNVDAGGEVERVSGALVSLNYFEVLGVRPHIGTLFSERDGQTPGGDRVVVLSYGYWQRRFGGDPAVVGRSIRLNTEPMRIVGVTPPAFDGLELGGVEDLRIPITMQPLMDASRSRLQSAGEWWLQIMGRLKPGLTRTQAESALRAHYASFGAAIPGHVPTNYLTLLDGSRGRPTLQTRFKTPLAILGTLGALVLALVCLNVANLMLARNAARQQELSITLALGAGPARLIRQLLAEAILLAGIGGALGLTLSLWSARVLASIAVPSPTGSLVTVPLDLRVMLFAGFTAGAAGLICGLAPALFAARTNLSAVLGAESRHVIRGRMVGRKSLVSAQIALSFAVLIGAGLFGRTLANLRGLDVGFETGHVAIFSLNPSLNGYDESRRRLFYEGLTERVAATAGVKAATLSVMPILDVSRWGSGLTFDNGARDDQPGPLRDAVGPGYFGIIGIPIVEGRDFNAADRLGAPKVAIVNEAFVRKYFDGGRALGRRIGPGGARGPASFTVVGVARDSRVTHVREAPTPFWYVPYMQLGSVDQLTLQVRTDAEPGAGLEPLRLAIGSIDKGVTVFRARTLTRQIQDQVVAERLLAALATAFGLIAAVLASIGLYGVLSFLTWAHTREVAVRMALGASPRAILGLIVRQTCVLVVAGLLAGLVLGVTLARQVESLLFGIRPVDGATIASAAGLLLFVTALATFLPARRATRIDPMTALHW